MAKVKMVEWVEPYYFHDEDNLKNYRDNYVNRVSRVTVEDAVRLQKAVISVDNKIKGRSFKYTSDEMALNDFIVTCWGKLIEIEEVLESEVK